MLVENTNQLFSFSAEVNGDRCDGELFKIIIYSTEGEGHFKSRQ